MVLIVNDYVELYLSQRESENCRPATIEGYRYALSRFVRDTGAEHIEDVTKPALMSWGRLLAASALKTGAANTYQRRVWTWLRWLHEQEFIADDIVRGVKVIRPQEVKRRSVTVDAFERLVVAARGNARKGLSVRDVALLELLWGTGLRRAELASLDYSDLDFDAGAVWVLGKGGKRRMVPIPRSAITALRAYNVQVRKGADGPLFLSREGRRMTPNGIYHALQRLGARCGVELGAHDFRRGCAARLMEWGMRETSVMHILGHESVSMTRQYARESEERRSIAEFHALYARRG